MINIRHKSLRLRIYPNKSQEILINKTFGCCRLIYNLHLKERINYYEQNVKEIEDKSERDKILKSFKPKKNGLSNLNFYQKCQKHRYNNLV